MTNQLQFLIEKDVFKHVSTMEWKNTWYVMYETMLVDKRLANCPNPIDREDRVPEFSELLPLRTLHWTTVIKNISLKLTSVRGSYGKERREETADSTGEEHSWMFCLRPKMNQPIYRRRTWILQLAMVYDTMGNMRDRRELRQYRRQLKKREIIDWLYREWSTCSLE